MHRGKLQMPKFKVMRVAVNMTKDDKTRQKTTGFCILEKCRVSGKAVGAGIGAKGEAGMRRKGVREVLITGGFHLKWSGPADCLRFDFPFLAH